ncbi:MAG: ATP-grasp domain-containing protein [archaeon]|nr:ATP-grasp domain-containing protein [archaeon]
MKKKILINGGGYADIPLIKAAKDLGFHVITTGNRPNDLGHQFSDEYIKADFSDNNEILDLVKKTNCSYIVPSCNDFAMLSASFATGKMDFPYLDDLVTTKILHHKDLYRKFAQDNNILTPVAYGIQSISEADDILSKITFPLLIKPVDMTGGKGISFINNYLEAKEALKKAFEISKAKRVILEEFIQGSQHSCSVLIKDRKVSFSFFADEYYFKNEFLVAGAYSRFNIEEKIKITIFNQVDKIVQILKLKDGVFHVQYIEQDRTPYIIEITRRSPGDLYLKLVEFSTGINYSKLIVKANCGLLKNKDFNHDLTSHHVVRHCVMSDKNGRFNTVHYDQNIQNKVIYKFQLMQPGDRVDNYLVQKMEIVFLQFTTYKEMMIAINDIHSKIYPVVD